MDRSCIPQKKKEEDVMIREIVKDKEFLQKESTAVTEEDISIAKDLIDTLRAHQRGCLGMAANMIGYNKNIIAFFYNDLIMVMLEPVIIDKKDAYETDEGCLSLDGERKTVRYRNITVSFLDMRFRKHKRTYEGVEAQVIQHEIDHLKGILI